jgi:ATP-dependent DNA ligase
LSEDVFCVGEFTPSISDSLSTYEYEVGGKKRSGLFANLICYQLTSDRKVIHIGEVGGGFSLDDRVKIQRMLDLGMVSKEKPLVLEVKANARYEDGKLRHNTFTGLREDKPWTQCIVKEAV